MIPKETWVLWVLISDLAADLANMRGNGLRNRLLVGFAHGPIAKQEKWCRIDEHRQIAEIALSHDLLTKVTNGRFYKPRSTEK